MRLSGVLLLFLLAGMAGCATAAARFDIRVRDEPNGPIRYEGPLAGPYDDVDELVDTVCENMLASSAPTQDGPRRGYCVLFFSAPAGSEEKWFISHLASLEGPPTSEERSCSLPVDVTEPAATEVLSLGGASTRQRAQDTSPRALWHPTSFLNQTTGGTWDRDVLVFSLEEPGACTVHGFIGFSGVVTVRRDRRFMPIATVYGEHGTTQPLLTRDE